MLELPWLESLVTLPPYPNPVSFPLILPPMWIALLGGIWVFPEHLGTLVAHLIICWFIDCLWGEELGRWGPYGVILTVQPFLLWGSSTYPWETPQLWETQEAPLPRRLSLIDVLFWSHVPHNHVSVSDLTTCMKGSLKIIWSSDMVATLLWINTIMSTQRQSNEMIYCTGQRHVRWFFFKKKKNIDLFILWAYV